jgi:hypothetical protein
MDGGLGFGIEKGKLFKPVGNPMGVCGAGTPRIRR